MNERGLLESTVRRFYDQLWNQWRFELAAELLAPELEFRGSFGDAVRGRDRFIAYARRVTWWSSLAGTCSDGAQRAR